MKVCPQCGGKMYVRNSRCLKKIGATVRSYRCVGCAHILKEQEELEMVDVRKLTAKLLQRCERREAHTKHENSSNTTRLSAL
jgi:hypothetical protein